MACRLKIINTPKIETAVIPITAAAVLNGLSGSSVLELLYKSSGSPLMSSNSVEVLFALFDARAALSFATGVVAGLAEALGLSLAIISGARDKQSLFEKQPCSPKTHRAKRIVARLLAKKCI